jgi:ketosteroid isomerase-like protein
MTANTELVQNLYAAFKRRDLQTILDTLAPDVSWGMVGREQDVPMAGVRQGKAGTADFFRIMAGTLEVKSFEPLTCLEAEDKVFVWGRWSWVMCNNGCPGENEWLHVFTFRDGKVTQWRGHNDTAQLAAAYRAAPAMATKRAANG